MSFAAVAASGDLDTTFAPQDILVDGVHAVAVTPAGSVLVGGWITATNSSSDELHGLARLNEDGTLDGNFGVSGTTAMVSALAIAPDDSIVCAGIQTNGLNAVIRRLLPDGSLDPGLDLVVNAAISPWIYALAYQPDGRLLVAGAFTRANGSPRTNLFRVNSEGSLDTTFRTNFTSGGGILALALQTDGRILIGGYFTNVLGSVRRGIARLNADGTLDNSFNIGSGVQGIVKSIRVDADGQILVGGHFFSVNGTPRSGLARLTSTGAVDVTFNIGSGATFSGSDPSLDGPSVDAIAIQGDGRIVVGGNFDRFGGLTRNHLARLHWNGVLDEEFAASEGPDAPVRTLALDSNGFLIIGGDFGAVGGVSRPAVARLENDGTLPVLPSILTSPEDQGAIVGRSAEFFVDAIGTPSLRYQWLKSNLPIAGQTNQTLKLAASQLADTGRYSVVVANDAGAVTSGSATLTVSPPPVAPSITTQPIGTMVMRGESVTLRAAASGSKPWSWQWNVGPQPVPGATNETLAFPSVTTQDAGNYSAKVTNGGGSATTSPAALVVFEPPADQTAWAGSNVVFRLSAFGPGPFGYQWWFEGAPLAGAVKSTLTLTNIQLSLAGQYFVVLSNAANRATSPPAMLVVNMKPRITVQPTDTSSTNGAMVQLSVESEGSEPLSYQWQIQGVDIPGQTSATLALGPLAPDAAARYSVIVSNPLGSVSSRTAMVTVEGPVVARLALDSVESFSGGTVNVPLWLVAVGDENTLAFSLEFDPKFLSWLSASNGPSLETSANLILNALDASKGRVGFLIAQPPGSTFSAGTNHLATLRFQVVSGLGTAITTTIDFGNRPVASSLFSTSVRPLAVAFQSGEVDIQAGLEADLSPSPQGDRTLSVEDWSLVAQMVAGLVKPADASEFARADCSPIETRGDGILAASDWTQAGRYVAGIDPPAPTGGPTAPVGGASLHSDPTVSDEGETAEASAFNTETHPLPTRRLAAPRTTRRLEAGSLRMAPSTVASVPVHLRAVGDENTAGFTVVVDPTRARLLGVRRGNGLGLDSVLILNTNQTAQGRIGVLLARPAGGHFEQGLHEVIQLELKLLGSQSASIAFTDAVVRREVVSKDARVLATEYLPSQIQVDAPPQPAIPRLPLRTRNGTILMRWDAAQPGHYILETSVDLRQWNIVNEWNVTGPATLEFQDPDSTQSEQRFFRMR